MIYTFLRFITKLSLKVYFKKIHIKGLENIPKNGPFIIVANHPSSFLDPISIAVLVNQKISFLAKASMFKNKIAAKALTALNMIPIYRAQDDPKMIRKNNQVFANCFKKLKKNGVIMIFPEGTSEHERRLRKIKTGAARIALGAAKENNQNVKILTVGLNYTKCSKFRSELFIEFAKPIETNNYINDFNNKEIKTIKKLTDYIEHKLQSLIIHVENKKDDQLMERVESLFLSTKIKPFENIKRSQKIYQHIKHYQENDHLLFKRINNQIECYFANLKLLNIVDKTISTNIVNTKKHSFITSLLILVVGFPFWLIGYISSYIPYILPRKIALLLTKSKAFYGALLMLIGTITFTLFYGTLVIISWLVFHSPTITLLYAISLPINGFFVFYYASYTKKLYYKRLFFNFAKKRESVIIQRKTLLTDLESLIFEKELVNGL